MYNKIKVKSIINLIQTQLERRRFY